MPKGRANASAYCLRTTAGLTLGPQAGTYSRFSFRWASRCLNTLAPGGTFRFLFISLYLLSDGGIRRRPGRACPVGIGGLAKAEKEHASWATSILRLCLVWRKGCLNDQSRTKGSR